MIDYLSDMKTATVADLRNNFASVSKWIHDGEAVTITKRGFHFATLEPSRKRGKVAPDWPDRTAWRRRIFPDGPTSGEALDYDRGNT